MPTGFFHPYWKPKSKGTCSPFTNPVRFEICIYKPEKPCLHLHIPKRKNPHSRSSGKERKDCGDFGFRIHRTERNSCVTHRCGNAVFRTHIIFLKRKKYKYHPEMKSDAFHFLGVLHHDGFDAVTHMLTSMGEGFQFVEYHTPRNDRQYIA